MLLSAEKPLAQSAILQKREQPSLENSSISDITSNQAYLARQLISLVEAEEVYFDRETNVLIKKLSEFLQPTTMSSLAWSSEDITQAMNQVSNYLENRTEELSGNIRTMSAFPFDVSHKHSENPTHPRDYAHTEKVSKRSRSLRDLFPNKQILFFKEDLHAAHVLYTLAAFANLLCKRPELINRLVFIVLCSSKISPHELEAVPEIVRQINQLYGTSTFVPVHFYHQEIDRDELLAFMNASHIGLCLSESAAQEFRQLTHYSQKTVSIKDPSDIPRLTVSLQDALY